MHLPIWKILWFRLVLFRHYSAHIMCSQFEMKAGLMKEFLLCRSWFDEKNFA